MSNGVYIGIDTSNYTTSLALCDENGHVLANLKRPLPVKAGERGLRQSDAVFAHIKNLPPLIDELKTAMQTLGTPIVRGIAYSSAPRRIEGSYMPCFLAGQAAAFSMNVTADAPVHAFSHQEGHMMAALYSSRAMDVLDARDFVAFHVSGGTTDVLYVRPDGDRFAVELIGTSLDLHAGQAVDRVGVALGLPFPCGRDLEVLAAECDTEIPKPRICVRGTDCHLSGLENLALALFEKTGNKPLVAAYTLDFIGETLSALCAEVRRSYPDVPMVFAGGVMSNRRIQHLLSGRYANTYFSEPSYSADNAAGVALLCRKAIQQNG